MVLRGPVPGGVDLGLVVAGEVRTGELAGGGDAGMGGGLDMRDSGGDVRLPWKNKDTVVGLPGEIQRVLISLKDYNSKHAGKALFVLARATPVCPVLVPQHHI